MINLLHTIKSKTIGTVLAACLLFASQAALSLEVGDQAPDFTLQASDGSSYTLSELRGKPVVIAFFPKAFTGGCTTECKSIRDSGVEIQKYDISYFMASVDDIELNTRFAEEHAVDFPILSDPGKAMAEAYGVLGARGVANRWTFYIDEAGIITRIDRDVNPATAGMDLTRALADLDFPRR